MTIFFELLAFAALAALVGTLFFYSKPQRESLTKQLAELETERGKLTGQALLFPFFALSLHQFRAMHRSTVQHQNRRAAKAWQHGLDAVDHVGSRTAQ